MNAIYVVCPHCRTQMASAVENASRIMLCAKCERAVQLPWMVGEIRSDVSYPSPLPCRPEEVCAEHLRVIRSRVGWLLTLAVAPLVLSLIAAAIWLVSWLGQGSTL